MAVFMERINRYDFVISCKCMELKRSRAITLLMLTSSRLGDGPLWVVLGLLALFCGGPSGRAAAFAMALSCLSCLLVFKLVKNATSRPRPFEVYPELLKGLMLPPPDKFSFPSGHSMCAFAVATALGYHFPAFAPALFVLASLIAASRVFLALHYPTDVLVGAAAGTGITAVVTCLPWWAA